MFLREILLADENFSCSIPIEKEKYLLDINASVI